MSRVLLYNQREPPSSEPRALPPGAELRLLGAEDIGLLRQVYPVLHEPGLRLRLAQGGQCYAVHLNDRFVHYSWVQFSGRHNILEAGLSVAVQPGEFWIYHCRTHESARGLGIYPCVLATIQRDCFQRGAREGLIYTTTGNIASQRGITSAGFRLKSEWRALRIGSHYLPLPAPPASGR